MLQKCNLSFKENSILTRDILLQMNAEPKWLILSDYFRNIEYGVISGFDFLNSGVDEDSVLTRGNIIINGEWYRMKEDYHFVNQNLSPGKFYNIYIAHSLEDDYEIAVSEEEHKENGFRIAWFKFDSRKHKRTFRVPKSMEDLELDLRDAVISNVVLPYYNNYGIAICPRYVTDCVKNFLLTKESKCVKEEIVLQNIMNTGYLSIYSLRDLIGSDCKSETYLKEDDYSKMKNWVQGKDSHVDKHKTEASKATNTDNERKGKKKQRGF